MRHTEYFVWDDSLMVPNKELLMGATDAYDAACMWCEDRFKDGDNVVVVVSDGTDTSRFRVSVTLRRHYDVRNYE